MAASIAVPIAPRTSATVLPNTPRMTTVKTAVSARIIFEMCGRYRVSVFNYDPEDLESELKGDLETLRTGTLMNVASNTGPLIALAKIRSPGGVQVGSQ